MIVYILLLFLVTLLLLLCGGFFFSALYQVPAVHQFDGAHLQRRLQHLLFKVIRDKKWKKELSGRQFAIKEADRTNIYHLLHGSTIWTVLWPGATRTISAMHSCTKMSFVWKYYIIILFSL